MCPPKYFHEISSNIMTDNSQINILSTIATIGIISAIASAIIYFMNLPIFTNEDVAWFFVYALSAGSIGIAAIIVRMIWFNNR